MVFPGLRHDIASYIIPEIEELMSSITNFGLGIQDVHQKVKSSLSVIYPLILKAVGLWDIFSFYLLNYVQVMEATCQTREYNIKATKNKNRSLKHILITKVRNAENISIHSNSF